LVEFRGFLERVRRIEHPESGVPLLNQAQSSRMFAPRQRLRVQGEETAQESDVAEPTCGGPDDEVILGTGELVLTQTDASLPNRSGVGFSFIRYYRSQVDYDGPLGPGWDHNCNQRIVAEGGGAQPDCLVWYTGQRAIRFLRQGQDWQPEPGAFYRLHMEDGRVIVETAERTRLEFEPAQEQHGSARRWRIARIAGRHDQWQANVMKFQYWPGSDVLMAVEDPFGNQVRFFHDAHGRLIAIQYAGLEVLYRYDEAGRLVAVTVPRVALRLAHAEDVDWCYSYVRGLNGRSWLQRLVLAGAKAEKVYDYQLAADRPGYGRVVKVTLRSRMPEDRPEEAVWKFAAEQTGNEFKLVYCPPAPLPEEEWVFPIEQGRASCYPRSRKIASRNAIWQWKHNAAGQVIEETRPLGGRRWWVYDANNPDPRFRGNMLQVEEAVRPGKNPLDFVKRGQRWEYHPEIALPTKKVVYEVSNNGQERVLQEIRFEYNPRDRDLKCERTGERTTRIVRNRYGLPVVIWDGRGCATLLRYYSRFDAGPVSARYGGLLAEAVADAPKTAVAAALQEVDYDPNGADMPPRQAEGSPCNRVSRFQYDHQGRIIKEEHPGYELATLWNKLGQVLAQLDTRRDLTVYDYDSALRRTGQWRRIQRLKEATYHGETRPDAAGYFAAERLQYDAFGRLVAWNPTLERLGSDAPRPPEVQYEYYPSGQLKKRITPAGTAVQILYDAATGWPKELRLLSSDGSQVPLVLRQDMTYDAEGFLVSYRDARGEKYTAEADGLGREFATTRPDGVRSETLCNGQDRPAYQRILDAEGRFLDEGKYQYDAMGRLVKVMRRRLCTTPLAAGQQPRIDEWLVTQEVCYDPEGNVLARRGVRQDGWERFGYDGLGRLVWSQSPHGDRREWFHDNDWVCMEVQVFCPTSQMDRGNQEVRTYTVTLRDDRGQPWCTVPVGCDGTVGIGRAVVAHYDSEGNPAFQRRYDPAGGLPFQHPQMQFMETLCFYNTLGLVVRETVRAAGIDGKLISQTFNQYAPDGLLVRREVSNSPLVFEPLQEIDVQPNRQEVPQIRTLQYDGYRRLLREIAPDGLIQEYTYGPDSRVASLARYHRARPEHREVLHFAYDRLGRVSEVQNDTVQRNSSTLQQFAYDWLGNITEAWDAAQPEHPLQVKRSFDNFGQLLKEQILLPKDKFQEPMLQYDYDMLAGKHSAALIGLDGQPAGWRKLEVAQDLMGRVRTIAKNGHDFCHLEYVGKQEVEKLFVEAGLAETVYLGPFLEPEAQRLVDDRTPDSPLYEMHYLRDGLGRVIASSLRVPSRNWECSKFYDRDSAGNLVADDTQSKFYSRSELSQKRKELLKGLDRLDASLALGAWHVRRYEYDEAGNMIASFRGPASTRWPEDTELASSWDPRTPAESLVGQLSPGIHLVSLNGGVVAGTPTSAQAEPREDLDAIRQWALASNRTVCKARVYQAQPCRAHLAATYHYDDFGRLVSYRSWATGAALRWDIEYDVLGRVVGMRGFDIAQDQAPDREKTRQTQADGKQPRWELRFAYDPFNRRIVKHVRNNDTVRGATDTVYVMLYFRRRPAVKLLKPADPDKPWCIEGQYVWGDGPSKVLAYYERTTVPLTSGDHEPVVSEYLLHQDAALNVVLGTRRSQDQIRICDIASYWGLGENSTTGVVREIVSSLTQEKGRDAKYAIDGVLDENSAGWMGNDTRGFLTLKLTQPQRLVALDIWADKLPQNFRVYVVGEGQSPRPDESLAEWEQQHAHDMAFDQRRDSTGSDAPFSTGPNKPQKLVLGGREGQEIALVCDSPGGIAVREFEVFVQPSHPGDVAFSGTIYDAETGLYYHGARYRLPELGTFISPDPLGFIGGDNLYAFAHNDPLTWHDPDGRFAHVLLGAGVGGALGAGSYIFQWFRYGEEWSWKRFAVYTIAGAASGATATLVGPQVLGFLAGHGFSATASSVLTGVASGGMTGAVHGAIQVGLITYLETGEVVASLHAGFGQALSEAGLGMVGGAVGGAMLSGLGGSFWGTVASGAAGGGFVGAISGGYEGYQREGTLRAVLGGAVRSGGLGAAIGGAITGAAWGIGRAMERIRPLPEQPEGLPDPRSKGLLVRTEPIRGDYGGVPVKPGYNRHHIKPLSLGGTDTPDNIVDVPIDIHRQLHPGPQVTKAPPGTIFY
jgi:RHS repeat-associated protein